MPTVSQIAAYAGVSKSTVSLVLNNKPGVSTGMRRQVMDAAHALRLLEEASPEAGQPGRTDQSPHAQQVFAQNGRVTLQSAVVYHPSTLYSSQVFSELLKGIQAGADLYGIQLRLCLNEPDLAPDHISRIYLVDPTLRPDGILLVGALRDDPLIEQAHALRIPAVLVAREAPDAQISAVGRDEMAAAIQATEHLLALGHRAIAFVGGDERYSYTLTRLQGYRRALAAHGIHQQARWVVLGDGAEATGTLMDTSPEVTAIIYVNDAYAAAGVPVLQAAGWHIPAHVSVVSFDDTGDVRNCEPPITSMPFPRYQVGFWSVRILVEQVRDPQMESIQVRFKSTLAERASSGPPRRA